MSNDYICFMEDCKKKTSDYMEEILPPSDREPEILHSAMRYSIFPGGKRIRPAIVLITGHIFGITDKKLLPAACGIELMHNFSLIHDDLPAMDNDDFRRGKETCHKRYGEAIAILAGDALLTLGFETIAKTENPLLIKEAAAAIGSEGMAGGQALDILFKDEKISMDLKRKIDGWKTGKLFKLSFSVPLFLKKIDRESKNKILKIAENFGIAFQIRDDIKDKEGDLGKLKNQLSSLYAKMKEDIAFFGKKGEILSEMVNDLFQA